MRDEGGCRLGGLGGDRSRRRGLESVAELVTGDERSVYDRWGPALERAQTSGSRSVRPVTGERAGSSVKTSFR